MIGKDALVSELNGLLNDRRLDIPSFRKEVNKAGKNVKWLIDNIAKRNNNYNKRIDELLLLISRS